MAIFVPTPPFPLAKRVAPTSDFGMALEKASEHLSEEEGFAQAIVLEDISNFFAWNFATCTSMSRADHVYVTSPTVGGDTSV